MFLSLVINVARLEEDVNSDDSLEVCCSGIRADPRPAGGTSPVGSPHPKPFGLKVGPPSAMRALGPALPPEGSVLF